MTNVVKLNRALNLVIPLETDNGRIHVHSTPIGISVFEDNFIAIGRTFNAIYTTDLGPISGPRTCKMLMKKVMGDEWPEVDKSMFTEMRRLTNVLAPGKDGWETVPYNEAVRRGMLDTNQISYVENALTFFTVISLMHLPEDQAMALDALRALWKAQITSSNVTEYMRSLPTSTLDESTGETVSQPDIPKKALSIPV
jgi:hypothetical protein